MLSADYLASIRRDGDRLLALGRIDPDRPVPQYPGWTMTDLLSHTGSIHGRTIAVCRERPAERISAPRPPEGADIVEWFARTLEEMVAELEACDPNIPVWGFSPAPNIGFWERRMVVETGVHRWDAESAFGEAAPLTGVAAVAGLDEFGEMWLPRLGELPTLQVTDRDLGRSWTYGDGFAELQVEGSASDILLRLMSRPSPTVLPDPWADAVDSLPPPPRR